MKGAESMWKRMKVHLAIGIICLISGSVMIILHVAPMIIPVLMFAIGVGLITTWFVVRTYIRGDIVIFDEMVKRVEVLSGYYSYIAAMYFLFTLCIFNYFFHSLWSTSGLLLTMMLFNSISFILIRQYLLRRGKTE